MLLLSLALAAVHRSVAAQLASLWTYIGIGGSVIVVEELAPVLAGFAAHQKHLPLASAIVACAFGGWLATLVPYWLGRYGRRRILQRFPQAERTTQRLTHVVGKRQWQSALTSRFLFGDAMVVLLGRVRRHELLIGAVLALVLLLILLIAAWKNSPHVEEELESFPD